MKKNFVHLNIHTQYSIVDSTIRIPELMQNCVSSEFPAVTITDQNNVFGMVYVKIIRVIKILLD